MFGWGKKPEVSITLDGNPKLDSYRDRVTTKRYPSYCKTDSVTGQLKISLLDGKKYSHQGLILTLYGDYVASDGSLLNRFFARTQYLAPPGDLASDIAKAFTFDNIDFPTGSYYGQEFSVMYGVEVKFIHRLKDYVEKVPILVFCFDDPGPNEPIHKEIGMSNVMHIEFVFPQGAFDCHDAIIGAAYFIIIKLRIVHMEVSLYLEETYSYEGKFLKKRSILKTYEIMDGPPCRGDHVPIRIFCGNEELWPFQDYRGSPAKAELFLRAKLTDENGKSYYKRLRAQIMRLVPPELQH